MYDVIVAATDFSEDSRVGVATAARLAQKVGARVVLAHVLDDTLPPLLAEPTRRQVFEEHRRMAQESLEAWRQAYLAKVRGEVRILEGSPHRQIAKVANEAQSSLIVVSSHGHSRVGELLLGSTTERLLHCASCPVLVVRPQMRKGARDEEL